MNGNVIRTITIRGTSEGLDKLTGDLKELAAAEKNVAIVSDDMSKKQLSLAASLKQQTLRLDEAARAQNNISRETRLADRGLRENLITQQQHAQIITLATQRYGVAATATKGLAQQTGLARHEMINMSRQLQDVGVSLVSGQSPFMVIAQQGTQMADILATSGVGIGAVFRQVGGAIGRFALSTGGAVTGLLAVGGAAAYSALKWNEGKVDIQRSLMGIGQQSGATAGQLEEIAQEAAKNTKISVTGARELTAALVQTGRIGVEELGALNNMGHDFAKVLGMEIPEANKLLAASFADPAKGVEVLAEKFKILPKEIENVQRLAGGGDFVGARNALVNIITPQLKDAAKASSFISASWEATWKWLDKAGSALNTFIDRETGYNTMSDQLTVAKGSVSGLERQKSSLSPITKLMSPQIEAGLDKQLEAARQKVSELEEALSKLGGNKALTALAQQALGFAAALSPDSTSIAKWKDVLKTTDNLLSSQKDLDMLTKDQQRDVRLTNELARDQKEYTEQIRDAHQGVRIEVGKELDLLGKQATLAGARSQHEHLAAQYAVDYTEALRAGTSKNEANQVATAKRAVAMAAIVKQEDDLIRSSEDQLAIAKEVTLEGKASAQQVATENQLRAQLVGHIESAEIAANQYAAQMTEINRQAENIVGSLSDQANVASAIGGQAKVAAQAQATYNDMVRQGYSASQALAASEQTRRAGLGAINAAMAEQLASLRDQGMVAGAATGAQKISAQAQVAYNKALREGATAAQAAALGQQTYANGVAAANAAVENAIYEIEKQADILKAAGTAFEATTKAAWAYSDALRSGADEAHAFALEQAVLNAEMDKARIAGNEKRLQASGAAKGYFENSYTQAGRMTAYARYGLGGVTEGRDLLGLPLFTPNATGLEYAANRALSGGDPESAISSLLSREALSNSTDIQQGALSLVSRLTELLPDDQKAGVIQSELNVLEGQPKTLASMELIKDLKSKLEELTKATEDNTSATSAMTDVLSPFYSSDPRRTHLGFRAFAGGGIMTQFGELPLKQYAGGGVATSPQVSVFGEGTSPEAYVPVPSGRIPVEIKQPANSNKKPVNITIHVHGNADQNTVAALRTTGFQQAQAMRRAMR